MKNIKIIVGDTPIGHALTWAYPYGDPAVRTYLIPTYHLTVFGTDSSGVQKSRKFEAFRFGVWKRSPTAAPTVVGLANAQTHKIKSWIPSYEVHSAGSPENGAWQVYGNFLIHDGPDRPMSRRSVYASIGCLAICGGPKGFVKFNDYLVSLSGASGKSRAEKLNQIGRGGKLIIQYLAAKRPALKVAT